MLYIVYIAVHEDVHEAWYLWMRDEHISDVLETGCFRDAMMLRDLDADTADHTAYRILYRAFSDQALARYQREFAAKLQADHTERFEGGFEARREILPTIGYYPYGG